MTILVIEDSRFLRVATERALVKAGHRVVTTADGQDGLRLAQQENLDVILLDMMLPSLEGTAVLRQLKQNPLTKAIPVIILSSLPQKNEAKLKKAGAAAYFEKSKLKLDDEATGLVRVLEDLMTKLAPTRAKD